MLLGILGASSLGNLLSRKGVIATSQGRGVNKKGKGIHRASTGIIRAGKGRPSSSALQTNVDFQCRLIL